MWSFKWTGSCCSLLGLLGLKTNKQTHKHKDEAFVENPAVFLRCSRYVSNDNAVDFPSPVFLLDVFTKAVVWVSTSSECVLEEFVLLLLSLGTCASIISSVVQVSDNYYASMLPKY